MDCSFSSAKTVTLYTTCRKTSMSQETSPKQTPSLERKMGIRHRTVSFIEAPSHLYSFFASSPQPYYGFLFRTLTSSHTEGYFFYTPFYYHYYHISFRITAAFSLPSSLFTRHCLLCRLVCLLRKVIRSPWYFRHISLSRNLHSPMTVSQTLFTSSENKPLS